MMLQGKALCPQQFYGSACGTSSLYLRAVQHLRSFLCLEATPSYHTLCRTDTVPYCRTSAFLAGKIIPYRTPNCACEPSALRISISDILPYIADHYLIRTMVKFLGVSVLVSEKRESRNIFLVSVPFDFCTLGFVLGPCLALIFRKFHPWLANILRYSTSLSHVLTIGHRTFTVCGLGLYPGLGGFLRSRSRSRFGLHKAPFRLAQIL